jgi:hypothetical protein
MVVWQFLCHSTKTSQRPEQVPKLLTQQAQKVEFMFTIEVKQNGFWTGLDISPYYESEPAEEFARQLLVMDSSYQAYRIVKVS